MRCKAFLSPSTALAAIALVLLGLLGACSSDDADEGSGPEDSAVELDGAAEEPTDDGTVVVSHRFGETEVPVQPERIVSLDPQWTDVLLALDAPPVGYLTDPTIGAESPWNEGMLGDAELIEVEATATVLPYEQVAALEPDLILVTYFAQDEAAYETLSAIAPTVATLREGEVDAWQDMAAAAGTFLDAEQEAAALVEQVDAEVEAVAQELPELEGLTVALVNYVPGDGIYVVADPDDGANVLFSELGLSITPTILDAADGASGRVEISFEQISMLDADVLVVLTNGADPNEITGWDGLPAVQSDAVAVLDYADITGLNLPSPLSVPYSLELIRPALEAAAEANG